MSKKTLGWIAAGAILVGGGAAYYLWQQNMTPPQVLTPVEPPPAPTAQAAPEPAIRYPVPESEQAAQTLPALDQSDKDVWSALYDLIGLQSLNALFRPEHIVRNIVVTVDNLPRKTVATRLLPTKPVNGAFATAGKGGNLSIGAQNAARYTPYVRIAEAVDAKKLVAAYAHFYPLFQRAYQELGYPNGYFNDRLVATIDHLLDAPEIDGPVALTQPHVLYKFADPELENASAGHKVMVRMGKANAEKVKAKLREVRSELTGLALQK